MNRLMRLLLLLSTFTGVSIGAPIEAWTPEVKFKLESTNYTETLLWISGFSYALSETAAEGKKTGLRGVYCLPKGSRHIGSRELLEILNLQFAGKQISSEAASEALLRGVRQRFPCNSKNSKGPPISRSLSSGNNARNPH